MINYMSKRGQLYIFAALILCVVLFLLIGKRVLIYQQPIEDDFEELSQNYNYEAAKFINSLLAEGESNVEAEFTTFTTSFTSYSKNQNPDFMLIYAFQHKNESGSYIYLGNYLDMPIFARKENVGAYELIEGCFDKISACVTVDFFKSCTGQDMSKIGECKKTFTGKYPIELIVAGVYYKLLVVSGSPEIVIISREGLEEQRKVYMNDDFVTGEKLSGDVGEVGGESGPLRGENPNTLCRSFYNQEEQCKLDIKCCWDVKEQICKAGGGGICS